MYIPLSSFSMSFSTFGNLVSNFLKSRIFMYFLSFYMIDVSVCLHLLCSINSLYSCAFMDFLFLEQYNTTLFEKGIKINVYINIRVCENPSM